MKTNKLKFSQILLFAATLTLAGIPFKMLAKTDSNPKNHFAVAVDDDDDNGGGENSGNNGGNNGGGENGGNNGNNGEEDGCDNNPTANCKSITIYLNASGTASITAADINNNSKSNCEGSSISLSISASNFNCSNVGTNSVVLTVKDNRNNKTASCTATVTVLDKIAPTVITKNVTVYLNSSGTATIAASDVNDGSTDNCSVGSTSVTPSSFSCSNLYEAANSVTIPTSNSWSLSTSTEASNMNSGAHSWSGVSGGLPSTSSYTQTPTVNAYATTLVPGTDGLDAASGVRFYRKTFTLSSLTNIQATLLASVDNAVQVYINGTAVALEGDDNTQNFNDSKFSKLVLNSSGANTTGGTGYQNFDSYTSTSASSLFVIGTNEIVLAVANWDNTATSYQDHGTISFKATITTGNGPVPVTLTVNDVNGNSATGTAYVTVLDNLAPTTPTLADVKGECSATATAPTTTDNCAGTVTGTTSDPLTYSAQGDYKITWTFNDGHGNSTTATQWVKVHDVTNPVAKCKNINLTLSGGVGSITTALIDNGSSDNCSFKLSLDNNSFNCSNNGDNTVTLTATDIAGNTATCAATVSINVISNVNAGNDVAVYYGAPANWSCTNLSATGTGGSGYSYSWSNGATTKSTKVCPATTTTYTATVTDNQGCSASDDVKVCSFDIRCTSNKDGDDDDGEDGEDGKKCKAKTRIMMCKHSDCERSEHSKCNHTKTKSGKYKTVCVKSDSAIIARYLKKGAVLGTCGGSYTCTSNGAAMENSDDLIWDAGQGQVELSAYPNPTSSFTNLQFSVPTDQFVTIKAYTTTGQEVSTIYKGNASADMAVEVYFNPDQYTSGTFIIKMVTSTGVTKQLIVVKTN
jgi:hypothetical protein